MRKLMGAAAIAVVVAVAGGGWWAYTALRRDPVAAARDLVAGGDVRGAQFELRNAILRHPDNAEAHLALGQLQLQLGDAVAAEKELKAARGLGSRNSGILPLLARSYLAQQKFLDLIREFPAAGLPPADAASLLVSRCMAQLALQDLTSANASAVAAERLAPALAEAPLAIARVAAARGDGAQALLRVEDALRRDPKLIEALGLKADLLRGTGDLPRALATLDLAVAAAPYLPQVRLARARDLLVFGEDSKAREDIEVALKLDPKSTMGLYLDTLLKIRARDWQGANIDLQKIQPVLQQVPRGEYYYALVKSNINQMEQASEAIGHYMARSKDDADGYRLLARIDLAMGRRAEAAEALKRAADLGGNQAPTLPGMAPPRFGDDPEISGSEALTRLAEQQLGADDTNGAARNLEQSLEVQPTRADAGVTEVLTALADGDADRAAALLDALTHQPKARPDLIGNLTGLVRMAQLDFAGAETAWRDTIKSAPTAVAPRVNLARLLALNGHMDAAEATLTEQLDVQPANRVVLRTLLDLLVADNKLDRAIAAARAARRADPGTLNLLMTEAALDARKGDFAAAYEVLDLVPLAQALSPPVLNLRAQILLIQDKKQDAADAYRQMLLSNPADRATRLHLIDVLAALDKGEAALKLVEDGLVLAPGNAELLQSLVSLTYRLKGLDVTLATVSRLTQDPANQPTVRMVKGGLYMAAKKYPEAVAAYTAEMKDMPFTGLALATAAALRADGRADEATALLRDWVAKQQDPTVANGLASLDIEAGRLDLAEKNLDAVLAVRPTDAVALNNLAWIYTLRGDKRALTLAHKAYLLAPGGQTADTLGWAMVAAGGQAELAATLLRRAAQQLPGDATVRYHLAVALKDIGQRDQAGKLLAELLDKSPTFPDRAAARKLRDELAAPTK